MTPPATKEKAQAQDAPAPADKGGSSLLAQEKTQAEEQPARNDYPTVAGPFKVGNVGHVRVVSKSYGDRTVNYARFESGTGRPSMIPLAAVAVLSEELD